VHLERATTDGGRVDVLWVQAQVLGQLRGPAGGEDAVDAGDGDAGLVADVLDRLDVQLQRGLWRLGVADLVRLGRAHDRRGAGKLSRHGESSSSFRCGRIQT